MSSSILEQTPTEELSRELGRREREAGLLANHEPTEADLEAERFARAWFTRHRREKVDELTDEIDGMSMTELARAAQDPPEWFVGRFFADRLTEWEDAQGRAVDVLEAALRERQAATATRADGGRDRARPVRPQSRPGRAGRPRPAQRQVVPDEIFGVPTSTAVALGAVGVFGLLLLAPGGDGSSSSSGSSPSRSGSRSAPTSDREVFMSDCLSNPPAGASTPQEAMKACSDRWREQQA